MWAKDFTKFFLTIFALIIIAFSGVPPRFPKGIFPNLPNRAFPKEKKLSTEDTVKKGDKAVKKMAKTVEKVDEQFGRDQVEYEQNPNRGGRKGEYDTLI